MTSLNQAQQVQAKQQTHQPVLADDASRREDENAAKKEALKRRMKSLTLLDARKKSAPVFPARRWRKDVAAKKLRYSDDAYGWRLPFVEVKSKGTDRYWTVPATSDYHFGYRLGEEMAVAYLKQLRSDEGAGPISLQSIVLSFAKRFEDAGGAESVEVPSLRVGSEAEALKGHVSGFFGALTRHLTDIAKNQMSGLDGISELEILNAANAFMTQEVAV